MPELLVKSDYAPNRDLIAAKGQQVGLSVEWTTDKPDTSLDVQELKALYRKHNSRAVNTARAERVKELMKQGKGCNEICRILRKKYGATMIKKDHAALSPLLPIGEGQKTPR